MATVTLSSLILILRVGSYKPDHSAMLSSSAKPSKCSCRCPALSVSEKDLWGLTFLSLTFSSLTVPSLTVPSLALTFPSLALTFKSVTLRAPLFLSFTLRVLLFQPSPFELDSHLLSLILSALYTSSTLIPLHQILVCGTLVLSQSCQCDAFQSELVGGSTKTMLVGMQDYGKKTIRAR